MKAFGASLTVVLSAQSHESKLDKEIKRYQSISFANKKHNPKVAIFFNKIPRLSDGLQTFWNIRLAKKKK
jgi:hypothetical protein